MPILFFILSFCVGVVAGFMSFSQGSIFRTAKGQILTFIFTSSGFACIMWAFFSYGWKIGLIEIFVVFGGSRLGQSIVEGLARR